MSLLSQIPKPSFIFDPSQANESRDALTQVRRIADQSGGGFSRAGSKYVVNKAGVLVEVPAGVPAVEFDGAFNKGYLAEPSATNLLERSEDFDNAYWTKSVTSVTKNANIAPDGEETADSILSTLDTSTEHRVRAATSLSVSTTHTASVYVKKITTRYAYIRDLTNNIASVYDLENGVVSFQGSGTVASITPVGEYYRIIMTYTTPSSIVNNLLDFGYTTSATNFSSIVPIGEGISIWGAQLETGSVATSYIPTTTAPTTSRPADSLVFTGAQDLIGQSSGVMLVDVNLINNLPSLEIANLATSASERIVLDRTASELRVRVVSGGVARGFRQSPNSSGNFRVLVAYTKTELSFFINNEKISTTATLSGDLPAMNQIRLGINIFGGGQFNDFIKSAYLWNNADWITDELAQTLTRI
jgi:hypothetical protein